MSGPPCPQVDQLEALAVGQLAPTEIDVLLTHVGGCADCLGRLQVIESHVSPLTAFAEPRPAEQQFETEPEFRAVLTRLHQAETRLGARGELHLGRRLGQYVLLERIGAGGMGIVYRALHEKLSRQVALKVLNERHEGNLSARARFCEEIRLSAVFDHPCLVRVTDAGHEAGRDFLVMELLDGVDLARLVRKLGPLTTADACELIRQAAEGLEAAHHAGIIHRDVKPSNLMLTAPTGVKILDLGMSHEDHPQSQPGLTQSGQVMGTWDYMAPEQRQGARHADARSDIYGLGATLHFLLSGQPPGTFAVELPGPDRRTLLWPFLDPDPAGRLQTARQAIELLKPLTRGQHVDRLLEQFRTEGQPTDGAATATYQPSASGNKPTGSTSRRWMMGIVLLGCLALAALAAWWQGPSQSQDDPVEKATQTALPTPPMSTPQSGHASPPQQAEASERDVAEWLLARGGSVALYRGNGPDGWIRKLESLPTTASLIQKAELPPFAEAFTDEDVNRLCQLRALEGLMTNGTPISGASLERLVENRKLKWLYIPRSGATDEVLVDIGRLPKLEILDLAETSITDAGVRSLAALKEMTVVRLARTTIGNDTLGSLSGLDKLSNLDLTATRVTDAGLALLTPLPQLKTLLLDETAITDTGLAQLASLPTLRKVSLHKTRTTLEGRNRLRSQLPHAAIEP